jgi:diguanylate cyclase (GGDEF)-like protein
MAFDGPKGSDAIADTLQAIIDLQNRIVATGLNLEAVMAVVVRELPALLPVVDGAVIELREGDEMVYRAASGSATSAIGLRLPMEGSLSGACVREGRALYAADCTSDPRVDADACRALGIRSMVCLPLISHATCVGACKAFSSRPDAFTEQHFAVLSNIASIIAASISHSLQFAAAIDAGHRDSLTGLGNRRSFDIDLPHWMASARRSTLPLSLAVLDLNGFKMLNDRFGHRLGDAALANVGTILGSVVRTSDTAYRIGGDEFAAILVGADERGAKHLLERANAAIGAVHVAGIPLNVAIGVATLHESDDAASFFDRADDAMYAAKSRMN